MQLFSKILASAALLSIDSQALHLKSGVSDDACFTAVLGFTTDGPTNISVPKGDTATLDLELVSDIPNDCGEPVIDVKYLKKPTNAKSVDFSIAIEGTEVALEFAGNHDEHIGDLYELELLGHFGLAATNEASVKIGFEIIAPLV